MKRKYHQARITSLKEKMSRALAMLDSKDLVTTLDALRDVESYINTITLGDLMEGQTPKPPKATSSNFRVVNVGQRDVDNVRIEVYYTVSDEMVASGQYNIRTNWAHVIREETYESMLGADWEDEMQEAIENRDIEIG